MDKMTILGGLALYTGASPELKRQIADASSCVSLDAGQYFYREGEVKQVVGLVGRGDIRVFKIGASGREITLYHVQAGESCVVNMLCTFLDRPAMASAHAEAPTEAVVIPAGIFREWIRSEDFVRKFTFSTMAARLVDVMTLVEEVAFGKMDIRLAELLARRYAQQPGAPGIITSTHEELAAELGTAREVVSRLLKEFERAGIVSVGRGHIELRDEARLQHARESQSAPQSNWLPGPRNAPPSRR